MKEQELVEAFYEILKTELEGKEVTMAKAMKCAELCKDKTYVYINDEFLRLSSDEEKAEHGVPIDVLIGMLDKLSSKKEKINTDILIELPK